MITIRLAGTALAAVLIAGCSAPTAPTAPQLPSGAPATSPVSAVATPAAIPTPQGPPLTIKQAGQLFAQITGPLDQAISMFQADITNKPPFSRLGADGHAVIAAVRVSEGKLAAANWPAQVQPDITSMMTTYEPAEIACVQAQINAGSYTAALNADETNPQCGETNQDETVSAIRAILNIPA
jgi:PBP1b-binding outer membrane lipoprotein LpoB